MDINRIRNQIRSHYKSKKEEYAKKRANRHNALWNKYYQSHEWKELREYYYNTNPCCEVCAYQGVVREADDVHHIYKFGAAPNEEAKWRLLLNPSNLMSLCKHHHLLAHELMRKKSLDHASIESIAEYDDEKIKQLSLINDKIIK